MGTPVGSNENNNDTEDGFDFVIVGSGAGGGPLAANLAEAGMRVLLLEAGDAGENDDYRVPAFHGRATEDPNYSWNYFVKHYRDPQQAKRDSKYVERGAARDHPIVGLLHIRTRSSAHSGSASHPAGSSRHHGNDDQTG